MNNSNCMRGNLRYEGETWFQCVKRLRNEIHMDNFSNRVAEEEIGSEGLYVDLGNAFVSYLMSNEFVSPDVEIGTEEKEVINKLLDYSTGRPRSDFLKKLKAAIDRNEPIQIMQLINEIDPNSGFKFHFDIKNGVDAAYFELFSCIEKMSNHFGASVFDPHNTLPEFKQIAEISEFDKEKFTLNLINATSTIGHIFKVDEKGNVSITGNKDRDEEGLHVAAGGSADASFYDPIQKKIILVNATLMTKQSLGNMSFESDTMTRHLLMETVFHEFVGVDKLSKIMDMKLASNEECEIDFRRSEKIPDGRKMIVKGNVDLIIRVNDEEHVFENIDKNMIEKYFLKNIQSRHLQLFRDNERKGVLKDHLELGKIYSASFDKMHSTNTAKSSMVGEFMLSMERNKFEGKVVAIAKESAPNQTTSFPYREKNTQRIFLGSDYAKSKMARIINTQHMSEMEYRPFVSSSADSAFETLFGLLDKASDNEMSEIFSSIKKPYFALVNLPRLYQSSSDMVNHVNNSDTKEELVSMSMDYISTRLVSNKEIKSVMEYIINKKPPLFPLNILNMSEEEISNSTNPLVKSLYGEGTSINFNNSSFNAALLLMCATLKSYGSEISLSIPLKNSGLISGMDESFNVLLNNYNNEDKIADQGAQIQRMTEELELLKTKGANAVNSDPLDSKVSLDSERAVLRQERQLLKTKISDLNDLIEDLVEQKEELSDHELVEIESLHKAEESVLGLNGKERLTALDLIERKNTVIDFIESKITILSLELECSHEELKSYEELLIEVDSVIEKISKGVANQHIVEEHLECHKKEKEIIDARFAKKKERINRKKEILEEKGINFSIH